MLVAAAGGLVNKRRAQLLAAFDPIVAFLGERGQGGESRESALSRLVLNTVSADTSELMIYGTIGGGGWWDEAGVTSFGVSEALKSVNTPNLMVRINSGGGDVFEGVAIHTLLARHPATVTTCIDGLAASAASFIAMAGDVVESARNGMMMLHDGMTFTYGNPKSHRKAADLLDKVSDNIADMYAYRAGGTPEEWRAVMSENDEDGTWYTGAEALAAGLVDRLTGDDEEEVAARVRNAGVPRRYKAKVEALFPAPQPKSATVVDEDAPIEPQDKSNTFAHEQARAFLAAALRG